MTRTPRFALDPVTSAFVIDEYNWARPFSNFLPGIAGQYGIPLWLFYVNRAQVVSSMGVRDKNGQILEFYSFNKAHARAAREGFRTFVRRGRAPFTAVDPEAVFGDPVNFEFPWIFAEGGLKGLKRQPQFRQNKTPAAFAAGARALRPGETLTVVSALGHVDRDEEAVRLRDLLKRPGQVAAGRATNGAVIDAIGQNCFTASAHPTFDAYCRQDFLDNVIRGGMPVLFETAAGPSAFYQYSRQNGDLERDYHFFVVEPTYLSQGTGHYRSVLQNRRTDTWFFPEVGEANLVTFLNLMQLDAYNPLEVNTLSYRLARPKKLDAWIAKRVKKAADRERVKKALAGSFTPGGILMLLEKVGAVKPADRRATLETIMKHATEEEVGGLHEGFWIDHWHYNLDLIDVYLMVYPDRLRDLLVGRNDYTFFDDPDVVVPNAGKCVDAGDGRIRRYGCVARDEEKARRITARATDRHRVRTRYGEGEIYRTNLLVKLLTIVVNRLATLDPSGIGMDMEAGKPAWNDSMNGIPGLFGSALGEMMELARTIDFLHDALARPDWRLNESVAVFEELGDFMEKLQAAMMRRLGRRGARAPFEYWSESNRLKEAYREKTRFGVSGREKKIAVERLRTFLDAGRHLLALNVEGPGRKAALSPAGIPYTYFVHDAVKVRPTGKKSHLGYPTVTVEDFKRRPVKLFLEGVVHWMRQRPKEARRIYAAVRRSDLFDRKLKMYKACENMTGESFELGRAVGAYPRGWIENESIYLHMEYKYLLEIIRSGLHREFWEDAKTTLMPFLDPEVYGRSTLEGASFIVSSAYHDKRYHGQAFQPRLSGITCEFLHIWILAVAGATPFRVGKSGDLEFAPEPALPKWLFTEKRSRLRYEDKERGAIEIDVPRDAFAFRLMGRCLVVYHNPKRRDTYGAGGVRPKRYRVEFRDGTVARHEGAILDGEIAPAIRDGRVFRIDVALG
jgi:hypothetical protein